MNFFINTDTRRASNAPKKIVTLSRIFKPSSENKDLLKKDKKLKSPSKPTKRNATTTPAHNTGCSFQRITINSPNSIFFDRITIIAKKKYIGNKRKNSISHYLKTSANKIKKAAPKPSYLYNKISLKTERGEAQGDVAYNSTRGALQRSIAKRFQRNFTL